MRMLRAAREKDGLLGPGILIPAGNEPKREKAQAGRGTSYKEVPFVAFLEICKDGWL